MKTFKRFLLRELGPDTLRRYAKKAHKDIGNTVDAAVERHGKDRYVDKIDLDKLARRKAHIQRAKTQSEETKLTKTHLLQVKQKLLRHIHDPRSRYSLLSVKRLQALKREQERNAGSYDNNS